MPFVSSTSSTFGAQGRIPRALPGTAFYPAASIQAVYNSGAPSGLYNVSFAGIGVKQVYINTSPSFGGGGGWALMMRGNANQTSADGYTFSYGNSWWTDTADVNLSALKTNQYGTNAKQGSVFAGWSGASRVLVDAGGYSGNNADGQYRQMEFVFSGSNTGANLMFSSATSITSGPTWSTWRSTFGHDRGCQPVFERYGSRANTIYGSRTNYYGCGQAMMFGFQAADDGNCSNDVNSGLGPNQNYCGGGGCWGFAQGCWMGSGGTVKIWIR